MLMLIFLFNQIKFWCVNYNQYIQNKIKKKLTMKAINYVCYKLDEKATISVKKNKKQFYQHYRRSILH